ncbi:MAG TPA: glycosyltransferase [Bacteroidales bacterium]|jgi:glycosyltransferase involved in cell wall biosynthesis|nr:glycosyltransferase [Bacteroidales bacterium]
MKILQVIPYYAWPYGGPVRVVYELSHCLARKGHEISIYTTNVGKTGRLAEDEKIVMDKAIDVKYFDCINNWIAERGKLHLSSQMRNALKKNIPDFDLVHIHEPRGIPSIYAGHFANKFGIPYIIQAHGASPRVLAGQSSIFKLCKIGFDRVLGHNLLMGASHVIALTETEALQYSQLDLPERNITVIPNGINVLDYRMQPKPGVFRLLHGIPKDQKLILFLGRIHKIKGIELLIEAFSDVLKVRTDVVLVLVGPDDGNLESTLNLIREKNITDKVIYPGPIFGEEKILAYFDADIYVLPSVYETFPVTVLEAMACGTPTVVTDRCGIAKIVEQYGSVVKYDKEDLSATILAMLDNHDIVKGKAYLGQMKVIENYGWDNIANQYENVYDLCINKI